MTQPSAILAATGVDRPGVLDEITLFLFERGANISDSRSVNLGGLFAVVARVHGTDQSMARIRDELPSLGSSSRVHVEVHDPAATRTFGSSFPYQFIATGADQSGVLHRISHLLRVLNINIENLQTTVGSPEQDGPDTSSPPPFELRLLLSVPREIPIPMLRDYLQHLCGELKIDWTLEPA